MNEVLGFAAVIFSVLVAQLFNNSRLSPVESRLEARMDRMQAETTRMQSELTGRIDRIQADLAQFFRELGRHDAKIEAIEKKLGE